MLPYRKEWTDEEDIILLHAQLDCGNKWVEIAKRLKGRGENSIKNRYNTLHKKYLDENRTVTIENINTALEAMTKNKYEDSNWINKLLEQKQKKVEEAKALNKSDRLVNAELEENVEKTANQNSNAIQPDLSDNNIYNPSVKVCEGNDLSL